MMKKCGRDSAGWLIWSGQSPTPMCAYHKEGPLELAKTMGWMASFNIGEAGPCESMDSHPDDEKEKMPA